jgi:hypothetical protein
MNKLVPLCAAVAAEFAGSGAWADGPVVANPPIIAATPPMPGQPPVEAVTAKALIGRYVTDTHEDILGEVESVRVDGKGNVQEIVLSTGDRAVAVRWKDVVVSDNGKKLAISATREQLAAMPDYAYAEKSQQGTVFGDADAGKEQSAR